jgi:hypothetical protein
MQLPRTNGQIDTEVVSDMILSKVLYELGCVSFSNERTDLKNYIECILNDIIVESQKRDDLKVKLEELLKEF